MKQDLDFAPPVKMRRRKRFSWLTAAVLTVCVWMAWMGFARVSTTNEIASVGRQNRAIEREIADLEQASKNADNDFSAALNRPDVKSRLMTSRTRLKPIDTGKIVYLTVPAAPAGKASP